MLENIIVYLGGTTVFILAAAWLTRSIVKHLLSKDIEGYKQKLSSESAAEAEKLKHALHLVAVVHEKRTSLLHEHRAEVIAELYKLLVPFVISAENLIRRIGFAGEPDKPEQVNILHKHAGEFYRFFSINRIYFSEDTCAKIDQLFKGIWDSSDDLRYWLHTQQQSSREPQSLAKAWDKAGKFIQQELPPLLGVVEKEFRSLLGVIEDTDDHNA